MPWLVLTVKMISFSERALINSLMICRGPFFIHTGLGVAVNAIGDLLVELYNAGLWPGAACRIIGVIIRLIVLNNLFAGPGLLPGIIEIDRRVAVCVVGVFEGRNKSSRVHCKLVDVVPIPTPYWKSS